MSDDVDKLVTSLGNVFFYTLLAALVTFFFALSFGLMGQHGAFGVIGIFIIWLPAVLALFVLHKVAKKHNNWFFSFFNTLTAVLMLFLFAWWSGSGGSL